MDLNLCAKARNEVMKKKCDHQPYVYLWDGEGKHYKCRKCKKIIKIMWELCD